MHLAVKNELRSDVDHGNYVKLYRATTITKASGDAAGQHVPLQNHHKRGEPELWHLSILPASESPYPGQIRQPLQIRCTGPPRRITTRTYIIMT